MKVEMVTLAAGPNGVLEIGKVYDLAKGEAQALLEGGYAVASSATSESVPDGGDEGKKPARPRRSRKSEPSPEPEGEGS